MEQIKKRCKWCHLIVDSEKLEEHEEHCNLNDVGREDMNYEDIENYIFNK
jgi:hypothetical protein